LVGLGSIAFLMQLIHHAGANASVVELDHERRQFAQDLGLSAAFARSESDFKRMSQLKQRRSRR
jgi:hypothetical protein